ncbi:MAG: rod shape-determining protein MreC [Thermomicrobiales bacterium]|nr:rod shape-determining protein MreC [Thermomicrobiales bacterium]
MTTLSTRQTIALVVLFVLTSLTFIQLDNRSVLDPLKNGLQAVLSPAVGFTGGISRRGIVDSPLDRELASVKAERDQLAAENANLKAAVREVEQLRLQAKLQAERPTWKMLQARVQAPDPTNLQKFLTIDKGSRDGVKEGMAVVAQGPNYIGQVTEVWERSARVMLVIDVTQRVGAQLDGGSDGVVFGMWQQGGRLELRYLDRDARPEPGELVLTTDSAALRTARVPGGLIVGRVGEFESTDDQPGSSQAPVIPLVAFEKLQVVTVVLTDGA